MSCCTTWRGLVWSFHYCNPVLTQVAQKLKRSWLKYFKLTIADHKWRSISLGKRKSLMELLLNIILLIFLLELPDLFWLQTYMKGHYPKKLWQLGVPGPFQNCMASEPVLVATCMFSRKTCCRPRKRIVWDWERNLRYNSHCFCC